MARRHVLIAGDSHIYAIKAALAENLFKEDDIHYDALRIKNEKNGTVIGDIDLSSVEKFSSSDEQYDAVVLSMRGNQYNALSLMQHPRRFDVMVPGLPALPHDDYEELIPYSTVRDLFATTLEKGYGKTLKNIAEKAVKPVLCLSVPAPKEDEGHILRGAETFFKDAGIDSVGVSPAALRLKFWHLQTSVLQEFCAKRGVTFLLNPEGSCDEAGFLKREYYAKDATHANAAYGALVLHQITAALAAVDIL